MIDYLSLAWQVTRQLAPWLLFGALVAGLLHVLLPPNFVQRHLGKGNFKNIVKASLFGVPMPLCSCGVIPAAIGLKKDGASDSATMGFLISTPQTGVDSIMVSAAFLGLPFALFKVVSAFVTGLIGGTITNIGISEKQRAGTPAADKKESAPCRTISTCIRNLLEFAVNELLYPVWKWIAVGILISAAISFFLPENALAEKAWATGLAGMFLMLLISLPLYVCATASVPIVASLVHAGMPTGAALVFLMAGPATNAATVGAIASEFGKRITVIYIATIAGCSILFGWLFDLVAGQKFAPRQMVHTESHVTGILGGILLLGLFALFAGREIAARLRKQHEPTVSGDDVIVLRVGGMSCEGCMRNVRTALHAQRGVEHVDIDLASGKVMIRGHGFHELELREAVHEAGYTIESPE